MLRRGLIVTLGVTAALVLPAGASAAKFCVKKPKCVQAGGTQAPSIASAIASANANGPDRDRIELGAKKYDDGPWTAASGNPVNIVGAGRGKTTLTRTNTSSGETILTLGDMKSRASDLAVAVNDGALIAGVRTAGDLKRIRVAGQSASLGQIGAVLLSGGSIAKSSVNLPTTESGYGVHALEGGALIRDSRVRAATGVLANHSSGQTRAVRLRVTAAVGGVDSTANLTLDQATVRMVGSTPGIALRMSSSFSSVPRKFTARHVTAIGTGATNSFGAAALASGFGPSECPRVKLVLRNSILRGFDRDLFRSESSTCLTDEARADINLAWTVFDPNDVAESGGGKITKGKGNRNVNPRFVKPAKGNYRLKASSPLIDKGQKGKPKKGESKRDLDGRRRVVDGDGNGKARRDVGAFERKRKRSR